MADINAALMKKIFDVAKRKGKSDIHHHRQADDLRQCIEIAEWIIIFHSRILWNLRCP